MGSVEMVCCKLLSGFLRICSLQAPLAFPPLMAHVVSSSGTLTLAAHLQGIRTGSSASKALAIAVVTTDDVALRMRSRHIYLISKHEREMAGLKHNMTLHLPPMNKDPDEKTVAGTALAGLQEIPMN